MAYWLTIKGEGSIGFAEHTFQGGPHPVSDIIAEEAMALGLDWLEIVEGDEPDAPESPLLTGTLTFSDVHPTTSEPEDEAVELPTEPKQFISEVDGEEFPSQAALDRHDEFLAKQAEAGELPGDTTPGNDEMSPGAVDEEVSENETVDEEIADEETTDEESAPE